ncbi:hypothetical protein B0H16DRAFT_1693224 [Mycena metata]|uniref:Uncharacterized protein n=1 Tax=Mycena metata TaxID=1033252 RepID=A0AAD7IJA3_9AGAR|nr:hypothetical protein B0H16DRAFT_1693224 [Mycena metata]
MDPPRVERAGAAKYSVMDRLRKSSCTPQCNHEVAEGKKNVYAMMDHGPSPSRTDVVCVIIEWLPLKKCSTKSVSWVLRTPLLAGRRRGTVKEPTTRLRGTKNVRAMTQHGHSPSRTGVACVIVGWGDLDNLQLRTVARWALGVYGRARDTWHKRTKYKFWANDSNLEGPSPSRTGVACVMVDCAPLRVGPLEYTGERGIHGTKRVSWDCKDFERRSRKRNFERITATVETVGRIELEDGDLEIVKFKSQRRSGVHESGSESPRHGSFANKQFSRRREDKECARWKEEYERVEETRHRDTACQRSENPTHLRIPARGLANPTHLPFRDTLLFKADTLLRKPDTLKSDTHTRFIKTQLLLSGHFLFPPTFSLLPRCALAVCNGGARRNFGASQDESTSLADTADDDDMVIYLDGVLPPPLPQHHYLLVDMERPARRARFPEEYCALYGDTPPA